MAQMVRVWYVKQRLWQQKKTKTIPEQYRKYILIEFGPQGDYYISSKLRRLFTEITQTRDRVRDALKGMISD